MCDLRRQQKMERGAAVTCDGRLNGCNRRWVCNELRSYSQSNDFVYIVCVYAFAESLFYDEGLFVFAMAVILLWLRDSAL